MRRGWLVAALMGGVLALACGNAIAQTDELVLTLTPQPSLEKSIARHLLEREAGQPVANEAILIDPYDMNTDGFPEIFVSTSDPKLCPAAPCRLRLYSLIGDTYVDLLAGTEAFSAVPPEALVLKARRRNGFPELHFGQTVAVMEGTRYVDAAKIVSTALDATSFNAACARSSDLKMQFEDRGAEAGAVQTAVCGCIAQGFNRWGMPQSDLDTYGAQISDGLSEQQQASLGKQAERVLTAGTEITDACLREQGLGSAPEFPEPPEAIAETAIDALPFFETCSTQAWIRAHERIGSEDRAMTYCSCLAGSFADAGLEQADVDGLINVFTGEMSDAELTESRPDAIEISDTESERCLGAMPLR